MGGWLIWFCGIMGNRMDRNRICLVIPSLQAGGMERVMSELAWYFSTKNNVEIHLILYGIKQEIFYSIPENIIIHKPNFYFNNKYRMFFTLKTSAYLRKTIKLIKPGTILSFGEFWNSFVLLSLFSLKYPVYISDRCQPDKKFSRIHNILRKLFYPKAAGIVAQTRIAQEIYNKAGLNKNIRVIGNPINQVKPEGRAIIRENIVLSVGRLIHTKHHDRLIKLFLEINKPGWRLIIVGYDHLKQSNMERLKNIISESKANDRVILAGKQSNVYDFYLKSKIFAFTSSSEGFPNVIGEAMATGLPVVAYDCIAGPSEMIKDGVNGYLVPIFDDDMFASKLELLMNNPELCEKFGQNGTESIEEFNIHFIGEKFFQFISSQC